MFKVGKTFFFSSSRKYYSENYAIHKLLIAPFTLFTLRDCECIGKILGACICFLEGYSSDDCFGNVSIRRANDGSVIAQSQFTVVPPSCSKSTALCQCVPASESMPKQLTVTRIVKTQRRDVQEEFLSSVQLGIVEGNTSVEKMFYNVMSPEEASVLAKLCRETGITVPKKALDAFLCNVKDMDTHLYGCLEREFEFEYNLTQQMRRSWREHSARRDKLPHEKKFVAQSAELPRRLSKLEKKRRHFYEK